MRLVDILEATVTRYHAMKVALLNGQVTYSVRTCSSYFTGIYIVTLSILILHTSTVISSLYPTPLSVFGVMFFI